MLAGTCAASSGLCYMLDARLPAWAIAPGRFMVEAFSLAWLFIPLYFFVAASLLILPGLRRDRFLGLCLSLLPFVTASILLRFVEDPRPAFAAFPPLRILGTFGVGAILALVALGEIALIRILSRSLFPDGPPPSSADAGAREPTRPLALLTAGPQKPAEARGQPEGQVAVGPSPEWKVMAGRADTPARADAEADAAAAAPSEFEPLELKSRRWNKADGAPRSEASPAGEASPQGPAKDSEPGDLDDALDEIDALESEARTRSKPVALEGIEIVTVPPQKSHILPKVEDNGPPRPAGYKRKAKTYSVPIDGILSQYPDGQYWIIDDLTRQQAQVLKQTLEEFNVQAEVTGIRKGPVITMFEILPAPGVKLSKIVGLQDNIALRLAAQSIRIVAPIPGKHAVGIEVPNRQRSIVSFREMIESENFNQKKMEIAVVLGKDIQGEVQIIDLTTTPHLLIAGATGAGKSVCVNALILSILYKRTPEDVKMIMIDPKIVELKLYNDIPHLLTPVITEPKKAFQALQYCICEMERRYSLLDGMGVRDIRSYNKRIKERNIATTKLPYIVVFIDEFADLMATTGKELESTLARLAAMSRAVGIHLVLATQRPSIDVITGLIKANIPSRIAFMVASKTDSRIIIDMVGAEKLLGRGDMLYASATDPFPIRMQGAFISEEEVERAVEHVKTLGEPEYIDDEIFIDDEDEEGELSLFSDSGDDPLMDSALEIVLQAGKASASYIQRKLKIGYNRAARLVEIMEDRGIVGPQQGSKPRDIIHMPDRPRPSARPIPGSGGGEPDLDGD
jgi:S-DNA-T family DNA segregation ATPase FtsK/SpoIIIE